MLSPAGLRQRSNLLQAIRAFFLDRGYIEVDTPIRLPVLIPEANLIPFASEECFLQTSPELCMKRLLARGCERIFQLCHCFRKEEHGRLHQSEFTLLEWYHKGWNYCELMQQCEELIRTVTQKVKGLPGISDNVLSWGGHKVLLDGPWERITVATAMQRYVGVTLEEALASNRFDEILVTEIEPYLGVERPVFLHDYPLEMGTLARRRQHDPFVVERFELYIAGVEVANGFSELNDPQEQRLRFFDELEKIGAQGREGTMPERFLDDLEGIGEAAGIALGVDRLCMLLTASPDLSKVMPFIFEEL